MLAVRSDVWGSSVKAELILQQMGLAHTRSTMVGGQMMRGISGGGHRGACGAGMPVPAPCVAAPWL